MEIVYKFDETRIRTRPFTWERDANGKKSFGIIPTGLIAVRHYRNGEWENPVIRPHTHQSMRMAPSALNLNYGGPAVFEGGEARLHPDRELYTFRIKENALRMNMSIEMFNFEGQPRFPTMPEDEQVRIVHELLDLERLWCPSEDRLYIRPLMFARQKQMSPDVGREFTYVVMLFPSANYQAEGALNLFVTDKMHRTHKTGLGAAKAIGNYQHSLRGKRYAKSKDPSIHEVLYLDQDNTHVEEAGTMNLGFVLDDGTLLLPESPSILAGITSRSTKELARYIGYNVESRPLTMAEVHRKAVRDGRRVIEEFGTGTAATIVGIGKHTYDSGLVIFDREDYREGNTLWTRRDIIHEVDVNEPVIIGHGGIGEVTRELHDELIAIKSGSRQDDFGWTEKVERGGLESRIAA